MKLLFRYVFAGHARLLLLTLAVGSGLYLLTELVERIDVFVEAGSGLWIIARYFGARLPSIVGQILPAVFLLASVITLCLMARNRETVALQAGGVSFSSVAAALVLCGVFWGAAQFACSQWLGTAGDRFAQRLWQEQVRKRGEAARVLDHVWFTNKEWIVALETLRQDSRQTYEGRGLTAYRLSPDGLRFESIIRADTFTADAGHWQAMNATRIDPETFFRAPPEDLALPIEQDPGVFFVGGQSNPQMLPIWLLGEAIGKLRDAGSNVEGLLTAWHARVAYAASLAVMALLAAAIVSWKDNVSIAVTLAIVVTFVMYTLTLFGESMGQRGLLPPALAAWGPNILLLLVALARLRLVSIRR